MTDPDRLLQEFIAADRETGGEADPAPYLARASGPDRAELEALIDGYLARAPRRPFDDAAYAASPARATAEGLWRSMSGASGRWPAVLPALRHRAQITRAQLTRSLAETLGVTDREEKVAGYYHAMEQGSLPAAGVQDRVLDALGRIVGESAERLRELGRQRLEPGGPALRAARQVTFARTAIPDPDLLEDEPLAVAAPPSAAPPAARDEVDDLFTGASGV